MANDQSLESAQTTVGTSALSAVPPLHTTLALTTRAPAAVSAEAVHDEGQRAPPLQPNPPSPSADSAPIDRPPQPASDAAGQPSPEPEPGRELRADAAADAAPDNVGDRAADNGAVEAPVDPEPPSLGWFADGAIPAAQGRYRFALDRKQLLAAVTDLAAVAGRPKKSTPTVRIALRADLCKLSVAGTRYEFAAIALSLKEGANGFEPGAAPVAFTMPIPKLAGIARTGELGPVRFELNGARSRLLVLGRRLRRGPAGVPNPLTQPLLGRPKPVGMLDPLPLAHGLRLLQHVVSKRARPRDPGSWSRAYVRDGMVFGCRDKVLAVLQVPGLAGLEAMVHAANLGPVSAMVSRLDGSCTGHFVTEYHSLVTDERTWVGLLTKPDIPFREPTLLEYLLHREPSDVVVVPCRCLSADLDSLLEFIKGEPGAGQVRLRVKGVGTFARLVLQVADRPNRHRGFVPLECYRRKLDAGARATDIDMRVNIEPLRRLVGYFCATFEYANVGLDVLPPSAAFPRPVLRLRHEVEGQGGYTVQAFLIGTP